MIAELGTMEHKPTLVVGASPEPSRYSYLAALRLVEHGHPVRLLGKQSGEVAGRSIERTLPKPGEVHTVTLYVSPLHQPPLIGPLLALGPKRIIFNPGTENPVFEAVAREQGVEVVEGCTLVMLATGQY